MRRVLFFLIVGTLACSLTLAEEDSDTSSSVSSLPTADPNAAPPTVQIVSPSSGQQAQVNNDVEIRVQASDEAGITQLQLVVDNINISTKTFLDPATSAEAILNWRPTREGTFNISVIAYRATTPSEPATISLSVLGQRDTLSNPVSGQPQNTTTTGNCTIRILIDNLRMRDGPGTSFDRLGNFDLNEEAAVVGQNTNSNGEEWLQVRRTDQSRVWVIRNEDWLTLNGNCNSLPPVDNN